MRCSGARSSRPQPALQAHQQALLHVAADRRDGQERRLVHREQVSVLVEDLLVERDAGLVVEEAVVVDAQRRLVGPLGRDRHAVLVDHLAGRDAGLPGRARDGREAIHQELGDRGPGAGRQADAARADAVAGGQRQGRAHGLVPAQWPMASSDAAISANTGPGRGIVGQAARAQRVQRRGAASCRARCAPAAPRSGSRRRALPRAAAPARARRRRAAGRTRRRSRPAGPARRRPAGCCGHRGRRAGCRAHAVARWPTRCRARSAARSRRASARRRRRRRACRTRGWAGRPGCESADRPATAPGRACPSGWPATRPRTAIRFGCAPAPMQAAISLCGQPSLVTWPLNSFTATGAVRPSACVQSARWITPEAPSPSGCCSDSTCQGMSGVASAASTAASGVSSKGLPANASQASRGSAVSQAGSASKRLAAMRTSSSARQFAISGGSACSRLPASISFCSRVQSPRRAGRASIALSVRISQRSDGGSAPAGTCADAVGLEADDVELRCSGRSPRAAR